MALPGCHVRSYSRLAHFRNEISFGTLISACEPLGFQMSQMSRQRFTNRREPSVKPVKVSSRSSIRNSEHMLRQDLAVSLLGGDSAQAWMLGYCCASFTHERYDSTSDTEHPLFACSVINKVWGEGDSDCAFDLRIDMLLYQRAYQPHLSPTLAAAAAAAAASSPAYSPHGLYPAEEGWAVGACPVPSLHNASTASCWHVRNQTVHSSHGSLT